MTLPLNTKAREDFAAAPAKMTRGGRHDLVRSRRAFEPHLKARRAAYLVHWCEAARCIARALDVSGGDPLPTNLFRPHPVTSPMRLTLSAPGGTAPLGHHPTSRGAPGVFAGRLAR